MARIVVIIPAFNERPGIEDVVRRVLKLGLPVVVVDDGSTDGTGLPLMDLPVELIVHQRNQGKGEAIRSGIRRALKDGADAAVFLDADGQHIPEEIPRLVDAFATTGADLIVGSRMGEPKGMPLVRRLSNRTSSVVVSGLAGTWVTDSQSGFRLLSRKAMGVVLMQESGGFELESDMIIELVRQGMVYLEVPITCRYGSEVSHYRPWRDARRFMALVLKKARGRFGSPHSTGGKS